MYTYTQLYKRAARFCGVSTATDTQAVLDIKADINQGLRIFKNASRRYWTRKEVTTNLVANQQSYTFPEDMVRITTVRVLSGGLYIPITMVDSEELWNRLNLVPAMTVGMPTSGFIRGRNELLLYPLPAANVTNGLIASYESRLRDMSMEDITPNFNVTNNSVTIVANGSTPFTQNMVGSWFSVTDGSDGNWYQLVGYTDSSHMTIENVYQGPTSTAVAGIIGQAPDIPEDYHLGPAYFAAYNYYLIHKDAGQSADYKVLYEDLLKQYRQNYAAKTTGVTQQNLEPYAYNLFNLPPMNMTS